MSVLLLSEELNHNMAQVYVSVGSNIEPLKHIKASLADMERLYSSLVISSTYESEAVGFQGDNFYNLVVGFNTLADPQSVNDSLREIEQKNGRVRTNQKFSARTLDLDLILYDDLILKNSELELPRDEIIKYAFVLQPLAEIASQLKHPILNVSYAQLWESFDKTRQKLWVVADCQ